MTEKPQFATQESPSFIKLFLANANAIQEAVSISRKDIGYTQKSMTTQPSLAYDKGQQIDQSDIIHILILAR